MGSTGKSLVLIIDDTSQNFRLIDMLFCEKGYEVRRVSNGAEALESVANNRPDLILLNMMIPGMDACEVCRHIKRQPENQNIPVIFLMDRDEPEKIERAFDAGGVDYITLPFHALSLLSRIKNHIRMRNLEEYKEMQEKIIVTDRFAAVGKLATTVAHEINSPLQGISVLLSLLKDKYEKDHVLLEDLNLIHEGFDSIKKTVRKLMDLSRSGKERKKVVSINDIITETIIMLRPHIRKYSVDVASILSQDVPATLLARSQMTHVFINLINNSIDAMAEQADEKRVTITSTFESEQIEILFQNTGPKVSAAALNCLFDPFYTTKRAGGMGLGLFSTRKYMENHNGTIEVENVEPRGCLFRLMIPVS